ncbi:MAG TPA: DNA-binding protein [Gammaproteobacteria bacterium]|nr:DNA-binding protein [Gammaproteobacteria bacterium]
MTETILRRPDVEKRCGLSRSTIYQLMTEGRFPRPLKLGKRAVGWRESDVADWLEALPTSEPT